MRRKAFVIGSNGPESGVATLQFAERDAERMKEVLAGSLAGYSVDDAPAERDSSQVLSRFEGVANSCAPGDTLLFYFSGHGWLQRGQLYLIWHASDLMRPVSTAISMTAVKSIFANTRAAVRILVLDCCHSGAAGEPAFKSLRVPQGESLGDAARSSASLILAACARTSTTRELADTQSGFLTNLLVAALSDKFKQADHDRDGRLSLQDLLNWLEAETSRYNESQRAADKIDVPELYGDFRGGVYLTSLVQDRNEHLCRVVLRAVERLRDAYAANKYLSREELQKYARPVKRVAPTFTSLDILQELFEAGDSNSIFAAAVMLQVRRDPNYMEQLIARIDDRDLRGSTNWRVLRAIRDTLPSYELTENGKADLVTRLRVAAQQRDTRRGPRFAKGNTLEMIRHIAQRLKVPYEDIFTDEQLADLGTSAST
jgi:hypothetical protein